MTKDEKPTAKARRVDVLDVLADELEAMLNIGPDWLLHDINMNRFSKEEGKKRVAVVEAEIKHLRSRADRQRE